MSRTVRKPEERPLKPKWIPPLVIIIWKDHTSNDSWVERDDVKDEQLSVVRSVGWLMHEDEETYRLVADHDAEYAEVSRVMTIGKGLVKEMKVLRKGKNGRNRAQDHVQPKPDAEAVHRKSGES